MQGEGSHSTRPGARGGPPLNAATTCTHAWTTQSGWRATPRARPVLAARPPAARTDHARTADHRTLAVCAVHSHHVCARAPHPVPHAPRLPPRACRYPRLSVSAIASPLPQQAVRTRRWVRACVQQHTMHANACRAGMGWTPSTRPRRCSRRDPDGSKLFVDKDGQITKVGRAAGSSQPRSVRAGAGRRALCHAPPLPPPWQAATGS